MLLRGHPQGKANFPTTNEERMIIDSSHHLNRNCSSNKSRGQMSTHEAKVCQEPHELKLGMSCLCKFTPRMGLGGGQVAGRHLCERTISVLLSCVDMLTNTLPAPPNQVSQRLVGKV